MAEDFELVTKRSRDSCGCGVVREDLELAVGRSRGGCACVVKVAQRRLSGGVRSHPGTSK